MIRQNFNAGWTVEKGDGNSRMNSFLGNTQTKTVHLPYDAMIHEARTPDTKNGAQTGFYPGGEYIFQKHFTFFIAIGIPFFQITRGLLG